MTDSDSGGYAIVIGSCFTCKRVFGYNPNTVPSTPPAVHPTREPICGACMEIINERRINMGLPAHPIPANAYEPIRAEELR